jgi:Arc/MetJ-type ribon-helix-helix transcriptional regulator
MEKTPISFKLPKDLLVKLRAVCKGQYAPKLSDVLRRGAELALRELKKKTAKSSGAEQRQ